ncbi:hypothetical protein F444_08486, partial [Phytophthora nicotianae P1976]
MAAISQLRPLEDDGFTFPTMDEIHEAQTLAGQEHARLRVTLEERMDGTLVVDGRPWIPNGAKELLARLFVVAHTGSSWPESHDYIAATPLLDLSYQRKVATFIRGCLL